MKKKHGIFLGIMAFAMMCVSLSAQEKGTSNGAVTDKVTLSLEFNGSLISVDSEGVVDSMADAGFNEDGTNIGVGYEDELWGATASLKFGNENLRFLLGDDADMGGGGPLSLDELYAWVKPFGEHFKFTGGIFENTDGVADYTDDIDDFSMGVFYYGEEPGAAFSEPTVNTNASLYNGFLAETIWGPVTAQLLLAPNYSKESASDIVSSLLNAMLGTSTQTEVGERFFRIGGKLIGNIEGFGTISALFKTFQWPMEVLNTIQTVYGLSPYEGSLTAWSTFGAYIDITAVENLGVSAGYTGLYTFSDADGVDNILWNGIDLRATYTGINDISLSTHNNISFAKGAEKDWYGMLAGADSSFLTLYNAIGATVTLSDRFSVNAQIGNVFSRYDLGNAGKIEQDLFWVEPKFIANVGEHTEFSAGFRVDFEKTTKNGNFGDDDETVTAFSVPIGIKVSF
jgi:hypothetical protein